MTTRHIDQITEFSVGLALGIAKQIITGWGTNVIQDDEIAQMVNIESNMLQYLKYIVNSKVPG